MKKFLSFLIISIFVFSTFAFTSSAEEVFKMKNFDKAYITFVFDDGKMPFTKECYDLFAEYDVPMCCAVVANRVKSNPELISLLKEIEQSGGEVLSHTYTHKAFDKNSTLEDFEFQLEKSYTTLTELGFKINGVIEAGSGGAEKEANYELMETVTKKYYKYSDAYGVSPQYKNERTWFMWNTLSSVKSIINNAIANKKWVIFAAHSFDEISQDEMREVLEFIKSKSADEIQVVNWNYIYENFGEFTDPDSSVPDNTSSEDASSKPESSEPVSSADNSSTSSKDTVASSVESEDNSSDVTSSKPESSKPTSSAVTSSEESGDTVSDTTQSSSQTTSSVSEHDNTSSTESHLDGTSKEEGANLSGKVWIAVIISAAVILAAAVLFIIFKFKAK